MRRFTSKRRHRSRKLNKSSRRRTKRTRRSVKRGGYNDDSAYTNRASNFNGLYNIRFLFPGGSAADMPAISENIATVGDLYDFAQRRQPNRQLSISFNNTILGDSDAYLRNINANGVEFRTGLSALDNQVVVTYNN